MLSTKLAQLTLLIGLTGALGACGGAHYYGYGPPPAPRVVGAVGYAPGPGYVWIDGFYRPGPSGYVWTAGRWARPPYRGAYWVPGRTYYRGNRPYWQEGYWRRH